jgi:hypothetical protein
MEAALSQLDRNVPVAVEPAAAKLLMPNTVRTVADILALAEWPAEQLRLVVERWQPAAEVRIERMPLMATGGGWAASTPSPRPGRPRSGCLRKFPGSAERWLPRTRFRCVPSPSAQTRTEQVHCYPICYPTIWDKRGLKQTKNANAIASISPSSRSRA